MPMYGGGAGISYPTFGQRRPAGGGFPNFPGAARPGSFSGGTVSGGNFGGAVPTGPTRPGAPGSNVNITSRPTAFNGGLPPEAGRASQTASRLQDVGAGFLDPGSDYYQKLVAQTRGTIGQDTEAKKRAAALSSAESGFGAGANPELMQNQAMLDQSGTEAFGNAQAGLSLAAPQMGLQFAGAGGDLASRLAGMAEQSRQFGANLGENARQADIGAGLNAQQLANQRDMAAFQQQLAQQDQIMRMFGMALGGF